MKIIFTPEQVREIVNATLDEVEMLLENGDIIAGVKNPFGQSVRAEVDANVYTRLRRRAVGDL